MALRGVTQAEDDWQDFRSRQRPPVPIDPALREAFTDVARGLPELWRQGAFNQQQKKAQLRCLIDKVVIHRSAADTIHVRIVWRGTDATSFDTPIAVASIARLSCAREMEQVAVELFRQGQSDEEIAAELTRRGYRSPRELTVIPNTVRTIRLKHGLHRPRSGSRPRHIPGKLTVPQIVKLLDVPSHWVYQRIERGDIELPLDPVRKLYLFPDTPETVAKLKNLKAGRIQRVRL